MNNCSKITLADHIIFQSQFYKEKEAIIFKDKTITYGNFNEYSSKVANGLIQEGVTTGTRVAYLGKDCDFSYEILYGCAKARAVLVPINWKLSPREILTIINDAETELLFVDKAFFDVIEKIDDQFLQTTKIIGLHKPHPVWDDYIEWRSLKPSKFGGFTYDAEDIVLQMYTSGTTGKPKGVQLSNRSFFGLLEGMKSKHSDQWMNLNDRDTLLLCVPFFHIGGLWWGVQGLIAGATNVIQEAFVAWQALEFIEKYKVTKMAMVPAMLQFVLSEPNCRTTNFSSLEGFLYGGSPINPPLMRQAMEVLNCDFYQIYGMTETGNMAVCLRPDDHTKEWNNRMKAAGKPLPGVQVKVVDPELQIVKEGTIGEICLQSPSNMIGYWKREEATRSTLIEGGWIRTGDAGYLDKDGYLYVCDRIKDMIICSGENIYPAEVEAILSEHEAIKEIAIIGIPDDKWGEISQAFIVLKPGESLKKRELYNYAKGKIADYKIPQAITFVDSLPRNPSGKIMKRVLREPFWKEKERLVN